jgi:non-specific protein-tyrosine kinase
VLEQVITNLALDIDAKTLLDYVHVEVVRDTQLIILTAEHPDPQQAASITNEIASVFVMQNQQMQANRYAHFKTELQEELAALQTDMSQTQQRLNQLQHQSSRASQAEIDQLTARLEQYRITHAAAYQSFQSARLAEVQSMSIVSIVEPAIAPSLPARPNIVLNTLLAAIVGGTLAGGGLFLKEFTNDRIRSADELRHILDIPVLAAITTPPSKTPSDRLVTLSAAASPAADAYHILRAEVEYLIDTQEAQVVLVTSSSPAEGRTTTAANLAVALAQSDRSVILIDADVRNPALHHYFKLDNCQGLTTLLTDATATLDACVYDSSIPNLRVLPAGSVPDVSAALLNVQRLEALFEQLGETDIVLIDTPPALATADTLVLAQVSDMALLLVRTGKSKMKAVSSTYEQLTRTGIGIGGAVLNRISAGRFRLHRTRHPRTQRGTSQHEQIEDLQPTIPPRS